MENLELPFTVLIPTRNRSRTLRHTIQSCVAQQVANLRIVVSDNCSDDDTAAIVASFGDPRIEYKNPGRRLSMSGNFEYSLSHHREGYVMHLGDDDGLMPFALSSVMAIVRQTGAKAVTSSHAMYLWPDAPNSDRANRMTYSVAKGYEMRSSQDMIRKVIGFKRHYPELPGTYSSFVHADVIECAKRSGIYYHSRTPDSYSGFVNASATDKYAYSNTPFAISGISGRSNGASQLWQGDRSEAKLYESEADIPFHSSLVYAPSAEIIVAEAFLQACGDAQALCGIKLDIPYLCRVAIREASPWTLSAVRKAAAVIHARHIGKRDPSDDQDYSSSKSIVEKLDGLAAKVRRGLHRLGTGLREIDCSDFEVDTIDRAVLLAHFRICAAQHGYDRTGDRYRRLLSRI